MILAAGYGTRLRPLTDALPKPMVPVANRPLIGWAIEPLRNAGVRDLIINLHYLPESIERYVTNTFDANVRFSREPEILGSGGGVRNVRAWLESESDFFLTNADTLQFPRYDDLARARRERDAVAALTLRHPPKGDRYTPVWLSRCHPERSEGPGGGAAREGTESLSLPPRSLANARDDMAGIITGFGKGSGEPLIFAGAQCASSRLFDYFPDRDVFGIVDDVYNPLVREGQETVAGVIDDNALWFDIGTTQRYLAACVAMLDATLRGDVAVVAGSRIDGDSIVAESARGRAVHSTIGARSVIEGDVRDSVVWDDCVIGAAATLDRCIVAHGVEVRSGAFHEAILTG